MALAELITKTPITVMAILLFNTFSLPNLYYSPRNPLRWPESEQDATIESRIYQYSSTPI